MSLRASASRAFDLLGRHVLKRAEDGAVRRQGLRRGGGQHGRASDRDRRRGRLGEAEIEQLGARFRQHHVAGLEVAVHDAGAMCRRQRIGNLDRNRECLGIRQAGPLGCGARQSIRERLAFEELHDQKRGTHVLAHVVQRADVGMRQLRDRARFAIETLTELGIRGEAPGQHLDGHGAIETRVARAPHFTHPAGTERCDDFVRSKAASSHERHRPGRCS